MSHNFVRFQVFHLLYLLSLMIKSISRLSSSFIKSLMLTKPLLKRSCNPVSLIFISAATSFKYLLSLRTSLLTHVLNATGSAHYWYPQTENDTRRLMNFFGMVKDKVTSNDIYRRELIIHLLRYLYLELFNAYEKEASLMTTRKDTRKEELANKFFGLIMKHFKENKDVAFYADKLCITSKYLTMVIKEVSGKSAKDWIVEYIVLEIKALLKNTNMNIQEIAVKTNFANQSSLGRFFRKHTGMSLSQYRMSNLG